MAGADAITSLFPEPVIDITIRVIGAPGTVTQLTIASVVLDEGDHSATRTHGSLEVVREASVLGWVLYYSNLHAVPDVVLTATGETTVQDNTDSDGNYQLGPMEIGDYDMSLSRSASDLSAIDALDASDILRALVDAIRLSTDQQRVADVSGNGVIGTTDAALILRLLVGAETSFPAGDFWQFDPPALQFRPLIQDEFRNFTAILLGDVNGDWTAGGAGKRLATAAPVLALDPLPGDGGQGTGSLLIEASDLQSLRAGTMELRYDPRVLRATRVRRAGLGNDFMLATNLEEPGVVRLAFAGVDAMDGTVDLVRVHFEETGTPGSTSLIDIRRARLNGDDLPPQSLARLEYRPIQGIPTSISSTADPAALGTGPFQVALKPNHPNPFNSSTVIPFHLPLATDVRMTVYDLTGQRVADLLDASMAAGTHQVQWDGQDRQGRDVASGTYIIRLVAQGQTQQHKLLLLR